MSTRQEFFERVRAAAEGTPYAVTETTEGFDVTLDIVDAQWFGLFNKAGLRKVYTHHVKLSDDGAFSVTDESRSLEWVAGTPLIAATREVQRGRIKEFGFQKVWAFDEHGNFGVQADYRFNSEEGREPDRGRRAATRPPATPRHRGADRDLFAALASAASRSARSSSRCSRCWARI